MTKIISALALLAVLAAATSSCSSNKVNKEVDTDTLQQIEDYAPVVADSVPTDSISVSQ